MWEFIRAHWDQRTSHNRDPLLPSPRLWCTGCFKQSRKTAAEPGLHTQWHSHNTHRHKVAERWERGQSLEVKKGVHKHSYEAESKHRGQLCFAVYLDHLLALCDNISWVLWGTLNRKDTQETWEVATGSKRKGAVWLWQYLLQQRFELQSPQLVVIVLRRKVNLCAVLRISQHVENITDLWVPCI